MHLDSRSVSRWLAAAELTLAPIRRPVPIWSPLLLTVWLVVLFASPNRWANLAAVVLILGAFAPIAARIAAMPNEQPLPDREPRPARRTGELQPSCS